MMQEYELRESLVRQLRVTHRQLLKAPMWAYLVDKGYVTEAVEGMLSVEELADTVRELWKATANDESEKTAASGMASDDQPEPGHERMWALSQVVAVQGADDPDVRAFRSTYLSNGLLAWSALETWVVEQAVGTPATFLTVPLPTNVELVPGPRGLDRFSPPLEEVQGAEVRVQQLQWTAPGDTWVRRTTTTAGGSLERLRVLAETLARAFAWTPAQAAVFITTGVVPLIDAIRTTAGGIKIRHRVDCAWARRVTLDVDPTLPPGQVARAYQAARRRHGVDKIRSLSVKHARLAVFVVKATGTRRKAMEEWNAQFPEWSYTQESNFRRDAQRAQARLLYPAQYPGQTRLDSPRLK